MEPAGVGANRVRGGQGQWLSTSLVASPVRAQARSYSPCRDTACTHASSQTWVQRSQGNDQGYHGCDMFALVCDREAVPRVKGIVMDSSPLPGRPRLGLRSAQSPSRVHRHVHQPVIRHRRTTSATPASFLVRTAGRVRPRPTTQHRVLIDQAHTRICPKTFNARDALTVPAGVIHAARNVGSGNAAELATHVVGEGKPLLTLVE